MGTLSAPQKTTEGFARHYKPQTTSHYFMYYRNLFDRKDPWYTIGKEALKFFNDETAGIDSTLEDIAIDWGKITRSIKIMAARERAKEFELLKEIMTPEEYKSFLDIKKPWDNKLVQVLNERLSTINHSKLFGQEIKNLGKDTATPEGYNSILNQVGEGVAEASHTTLMKIWGNRELTENLVTNPTEKNFNAIFLHSFLEYLGTAIRDKHAFFSSWSQDITQKVEEYNGSLSNLSGILGWFEELSTKSPELYEFIRLSYRHFGADSLGKIMRDFKRKNPRWKLDTIMRRSLRKFYKTTEFESFDQLSLAIGSARGAIAENFVSMFDSLQDFSITHNADVSAFRKGSGSGYSTYDTLAAFSFSPKMAAKEVTESLLKDSEKYQSKRDVREGFVNNMEELREKATKLEAKIIIVAENVKAYNLQSAYSKKVGYSGGERQVRTHNTLLDKYLASSMGGVNRVERFLRRVVNMAPYLILSNAEENVIAEDKQVAHILRMFIQDIADLLFDDFIMDTKAGDLVTVLHMFLLNNQRVPLSTLLFAVAASMEESTPQVSPASKTLGVQVEVGDIASLRMFLGRRLSYESEKQKQKPIRTRWLEKEERLQGSLTIGTRFMKNFDKVLAKYLQ